MDKCISSGDCWEERTCGRKVEAPASGAKEGIEDKEASEQKPGASEGSPS